TCTTGTSLYDAGPGYDSYRWTLDGTVVGSSRFATIGPLSAGQHSLGLLVDADGCQATASLSLTTQASPPAPPASNNGPIPFGGTIQLLATSVAGATYHWTGPDGFVSDLQNPVVVNATPAASGRYEVVARQGGCASARAATDAVVLPAPACPG